jgi:UDP-glucose 4-epimerase
VVGASGFIGSALVRRIQSDGLPVGSFTREVPFLARSGEIAAEVAASHTVFWLSASINPAVAEHRPDLAAYDQTLFETFLRALEPLDRCPRVVLLSSGGTVYDPAAEAPYAEDSPVRGVTAYARAKLALEQTLLSAHLPDTCKVVVRAANAYGPGQPARRGQGVISHWLNAARDGRPLVLFGDRDTVRDYVYIDDLVDALVEVHIVAGDLPSILNVGSGQPTSLGEVAQTVVDVVGDNSLLIETRPARPFDLPNTWLDIDLAMRTLNWGPRTALRDGVAAAWRSVCEPDDTPDRSIASTMVEK